MSEIRLESSWKNVLQDEFAKPYWKALTEFVRTEYKSAAVYPPPQRIFHAFEATPFHHVSVVILGQDPYHGEGQANGLCFSVNDGVRLPPSLQNIYKEIEADTGVKMPPTGNIEHWAKQGVLLLNATLTVRANTAGSHQNKGWEQFTDAAVQALSEQKEHLVFLLWGAYAQKKGTVIDRSKHLVLTSAHPSPFSATGFFGNHHFSKTNQYLVENKKAPIQWAP